MTYWLVFTTLFWAHVFGNYATESECRDAAMKAPWYVATSCIPQPKPTQDHQH